MIEDNEYLVVGPDSSKEDLERAKFLAEIHEIKARTADLVDRQTVSGSDQYNNRVIHYVDVVDYKSTQKVITQLSEMVRWSGDPIEIILHSPGGDVFSGMALYDYIQHIRQEGIHVTMVTLGGAFSMAGILLQAGDHRVMTPHSWLMIHEAGMSTAGQTSALKDEVGLLERLEKQGNALLAARSIFTPEQIEEKCHRKNWWIDAEEALKFGFIDEIRPAPAAPAVVVPIKKPRTRKAAA